MSSVRTGRIQRDVEQISQSPQPNIAVWPVNEKSLEELCARLTGPENSPFSGGSFYLSVKFPDRYPFEPPHVTFKTRIHHPNVDAQGRICLDLLKLPPQGTWKPHINLSSVLTSILLLMSEPNPNDPLDPQIAEEFKTNRALFDQHARQLTQKYAIDAKTEVASVTTGTAQKRKSCETTTVVDDGENVGETSVIKPLVVESSKVATEKPSVSPQFDSKPTITTTTTVPPPVKKNPFAVLAKKPKLT